MSKFGERLRNELNRKGLKQVDFAERIGLSKVAINRYVMGKREPPYDTLIRIANSLDVTVDYLIGNDIPKAKQVNVKADTYKRARRYIPKVRIIGRWEYVGFQNKFKCSECGAWIEYYDGIKAYYCSNCGAEMIFTGGNDK